MDVRELLFPSSVSPARVTLFDLAISSGQVTILVNNAGMVTGKLLMDIPDKLIEKTFEVNTLAHFWVS